MTGLPPAPKPIDENAAKLLREAASRAGFTDKVFQILGPLGFAGWKGNMRSALGRLPTPECGVFASFFLIRDEVPEDVLAPALGGAEVVSALERAGLTERGAGGLRCPLQLMPGAGVLAFSDPIDDPGTETPPDEFILPIGRATRYVDDLAVRAPCEIAVDLGCGQGYLALRSMTHAQRCIATDINARAIEFARCNASLAGFSDRIECREGSLFEPLQDVFGRVDLLTCNPPFIILPGSQTTALVNAFEGDKLVETLVRTTPEALREEGWASIIGLWEHGDANDWSARMQGWVEGSGCDALILQFRTYKPLEYFEQWFAPEVRASSMEGFTSLVERRNIGAITFGGVVLRKRRGLNWTRSVFTLINARTGPGSDQIRAFFRTQTAVETMASPAALLNRRLRLARGWLFDPTLPFPNTPPAPPSDAARGLAMPLQHAANFEPILSAFDGNKPARQVLGELHASGRLPIDPGSPQAAGLLLNLARGGCLDLMD